MWNVVLWATRIYRRRVQTETKRKLNRWKWHTPSKYLRFHPRWRKKKSSWAVLRDSLHAGSFLQPYNDGAGTMFNNRFGSATDKRMILNNHSDELHLDLLLWTVDVQIWFNLKACWHSKMLVRNAQGGDVSAWFLVRFAVAKPWESGVYMQTMMWRRRNNRLLVQVHGWKI